MGRGFGPAAASIEVGRGFGPRRPVEFWELRALAMVYGMVAAEDFTFTNRWHSILIPLLRPR